MKKNKEPNQIRIVVRNAKKGSKVRRPRKHPCADLSDEERKRGIVDILASALVEAHRKKEGS